MAKEKSDSIKDKSAKELLTQSVIDFFDSAEHKQYNYKQIAEELDAKSRQQRQMISEILESLALSGFLTETVPGKYKAKSRGVTVTGTFERKNNGKNRVITDEDGEKIFVAERNSKHALNGDKVQVYVYACRKGKQPEAEVVEILESKPQQFIGTLQVEKYFAHLLTDSKVLASDIFIPKEKLKNGKTGDKAIVKITSWPEESKNPRGEVIDILGKTGENTTEMHAILAEFGLPYKYPDTVNAAAEKIDAGITPEEIAKREDFRDVTTFTIDPKDAKDFDDALSIRKIADNKWEVGVHIADVTHYVQPDTLLDKEAQKRATSVYLVDRVVPMLPEHLSNGICSLRPNEEKLTFSCTFTLDENAKVLDSRIGRTVIKSDRRFTYEEAQNIIETGVGDLSEEVLTLNKFAQILRKQRFEDGAVAFDRYEVRFEIDETGRPISVYFKVSKEANKLVEEFMLLANKYVAQAIGKVPAKKKAKAFVYRVHDNPDPDKMQNFAELARRFGYKLKVSGKARETNKSLNKLLVDVKGKGEENLISTLAIRSMAKAVYTTVNVGHYGLAFDYYTHFTSPIRRYPDMMVHRLLDKYMHGGRSVNAEKLEEQCKHSSDMEQLAANAERASIKYKQVEYMGERLGDIYEGTISGVAEWGLYVEIDENKCEGLVPIRDLEDDYYEYDDKSFCLVGRRKKRRFQLGDAVKIRVARANLEKKQLDFELIDENSQHKSSNVASPARKNEKKQDTANNAGKSKQRHSSGSRKSGSSKAGSSKSGSSKSGSSKSGSSKSRKSGKSKKK